MYPPCLICGQPADKTGSHILSWFLIRDCVNKIGAKDRGNEISFELSADRFVTPYYGQSVLPEQISRVKSRSITEEDIEKIKKEPNPYTRDNILCTVCESKLGALESYVSKNVFDRLRNLPEVKDHKFTVEASAYPEAVRLLIYSLCLLSERSNFSGFRMQPKHSTTLKRILNESLGTTEAELIKNIQAKSDHIKSLPVLTTFMQTIGINDNSMTAGLSENPYWMIMNDFSFQLFFDEKSPKRNNEKVYGINSIIQKMKTLNHKEDKIKISIINNVARKRVNGKMMEFIVEEFDRSAKSKFNALFNRLFRRNAPHSIMLYYLYLAKTGNTFAVENHTTDQFADAARTAVLEYARQSDIPVSYD